MGQIRTKMAMSISHNHDVHKNGNYTVANPKMGKVLATRCLQSECKLYIDLVLGTTEKEYQDALDEAKKLEP